MAQHATKQISTPVDERKLNVGLASTNSISGDVTPNSALTHYITGWRIHAITVGLVVAHFIAMVEALIASTDVLAITDDLGGYEKSSWVFTAYLLTFCDFQMVYGKLSDLIGRKFTILSALFIFTVFSGLCGANQTLDQL
jgi:MFS family permease